MSKPISKRQAARDMLAALEIAEARMAKCPEFNAWDLGVGPTLQTVRDAIAAAKAAGIGEA